MKRFKCILLCDFKNERVRLKEKNKYQNQPTAKKPTIQVSSLALTIRYTSNPDMHNT